ncbi:hypothetical protein [Hydrogenophaga electricum]|uniref:Transcriptional regulator n=1 Tax=Hydrogenophaga electricum TaxID=1230953 RepID=A0ABQ6C0Z5_9BURK|nr:hypothetical protein [Hydrogenophaga electricum]GLS13530.1 hypothetical protein GCM10007935_09600 [Hydrogenophaga electricum]
MNENIFPPAVLPIGTTADNTMPIELDKRIVGERNRTEVLSWLSRFGWLTGRMVAALVWPDAAQAQAMARRTLKALTDEKLVIARAMPKGTVYVLSAKGARLLTEQTGMAAEGGNALALGNPVHRACSNWYLIRAVQQGLGVVTEHEIATERGPCRVLKGKQADGLVIASDGACVWLECENSQKSRPERHKTVSLVQECIGGERQVELAPGRWLARVALVATNEQALRWMAASFQDAHRAGRLSDSQVAEVDVCLLPISESLVPGDAIDGNLYWNVLLPASA